MDKAFEELKGEIKELIVETVRPPDVRPEDIEDDAPLFGTESLSLDSIDALEIFLAIQRRYGVRVDGQNVARAAMESVDKIARFVQANRTAVQESSSPGS